MSAWEAAYALLVVQVTLLSVMAGAAYLVVARRHATTAKRILGITVLLFLGLTAAAALPLPGSWSLGIWPKEAVGAVPLEPPSDDRITMHRGTSTGMPDVSGTSGDNAISVAARLLDTSGPAPSRQSTAVFPWTLLLELLLVAGGIIACIRLVRGLWCTHRLVRHSRRVDDVAFVGLAEEVRRLIGCRPVELRVSTHISSAATVGWRRPVLIVAADWRKWSERDLRAVLAHEMTHVGSNDYLMGLVARVTMALYFYHPLVRWLGTRLSLAHEAVADAAAARLVGGRANYLVALSRIALSQDRQIASLPVSAFSTSFSTFLMRRIEMLEIKDDRQSPRMRLIQWVTLGCLCLGAIAVSALRAPAQENKAEPEAPPLPVRTARKDTRESTLPGAVSLVRGTSTPDETRLPIELRYVPGIRQGVISVRPATIFGRPEIVATVNQVDEVLRQALRMLNVPDHIDVSLADLEQVAGQITLSVDPDAPLGERNRLCIGLGMFRTTKPYPWGELLEAIAPGTKATEHEGGKTLEAPEPPIPLIAPVKAFALPDPRTVVPAWPAAAIPRMLKVWQQDPLDSAAWADDWALVQESTVAFVLDNTSGNWSEYCDGSTDSKILAHPEQHTEEEYWGSLAANFQYAVCGIDWRGHRLSVLLTVECQSPDVASDVVAGLPELIAEMRAKAVQGLEVAGDHLEARLHRLSIELLDQIEIRSFGSKVRLSTTNTLDPGLVAACLSYALLQESGE
ncbi:MAG: M56 family metallopeptidase [Planctomycetota bacterium]|jgi:beta-lactamase regulating signal transducer with metallopeptidase domain